MAIVLPNASDYTNSPSHSRLHRVVAVDGAAPEQSLIVNSAGDVVASARVRMGEVWHSYGGFQDQSATVTVSDVNVWYHITNVANNLWTGFESDGLTVSGDIMTVLNTGHYFGTVAMSISGSNQKDFQIRLYNITQATEQGYHIGTTTTGANNYTDVTLPIFVEAVANDQLRLEVRCITDASSPTFRSAVFYVSYLHD